MKSKGSVTSVDNALVSGTLAEGRASSRGCTLRGISNDGLVDIALYQRKGRGTLVRDKVDDVSRDHVAAIGLGDKISFVGECDNGFCRVLYRMHTRDTEHRANTEHPPSRVFFKSVNMGMSPPRMCHPI